jgi:hypothetical protein
VYCTPPLYDAAHRLPMLMLKAGVHVYAPSPVLSAAVMIFTAVPYVVGDVDVVTAGFPDTGTGDVDVVPDCGTHELDAVLKTNAEVDIAPTCTSYTAFLGYAVPLAKVMLMPLLSVRGVPLVAVVDVALPPSSFHETVSVVADVVSPVWVTVTS